MATKGYGDRDPRLIEAGQGQAERLGTAASNIEEASSVLWALINAHDEARARNDERALNIQPVTPSGSDGRIAEGVLAIADELLVWDEKARDAVDALVAEGIGVTPGDLVTTRVRSLLLDSAGSREDGAQQLANAVTILDGARIRVSFDHAVIHNDLQSIFSPIRPFMTAKGAVPPLPAAYTLLPRPPISEGARRVKVAVIDTGAEVQRADPQWRRTDGWLREVAGADDPTTEGDKDDYPLVPGAGHGSAVAGIVEFQCPSAEVTSYAALYVGLGSEVAVAQAITQAVVDGAEVINLSLGTPALPHHAPLAIEDALSELPDHVLVVAAAGNSGSYDLHYPAAFKRVIGVGATNAELEPEAYSNRGFWVDISTRGTGIAAPFTQGTFANAGNPVTFSGRDPIAAVTGTSFAAPQVSGALAQLLSEGHAPAEAVTKLESTGRPEPDFGVVVPLLQQ